jgi:DNA segregation ATPase FtsK/SpoIIIE, S-DNA-T family
MSGLWAKLMIRKKLIKAFRSGDMYLTYKMSDDNERLIFPKIRNVSINDASTTITFTLPNGLDPKLLQKNYYVFEQYFGQNVELDGEVKRFTLTVNKGSLPKELTYNYSKIEPELEGFEMPIVCGKDSAGNWMVYDAITEPNCLVSGEPGAGKSTQLRSILTTLIQHRTPDELHIYLGDLKMSEFFLFKDVEHVKSVCVYPEDMARMLKHIHGELKRRGELLNKHRVTHITKVPEKTPFILLAIDEIVMIMDDRDMKKQLVQIVSLGRALGIYCILSLQRPSHDILDTKVRGLLTVRMGFRTTDASNSKIIGTPGSERISKGTPGRFLIKRDELTELQAPYLTEEKADKILAAYRIDGWKDMFARTVLTKCQTGEESKQVTSLDLTEKDVFLDATE